MTPTAWERRKALSDRLRGVWDARRDGNRLDEAAFVAARGRLSMQLAHDSHTVASISWDEFLRLQGLKQ